MKGLDLINSAMRLIGVLASGEVPSNAEAQDGLTILNQMIDEWNAQRLLIFTEQRIVSVNLTAGKQVYTCGTGGDFNIARPPKIDRFGIINLANPLQPLELPMDKLTDAGWQAIPVKAIQSALPSKIWDDLQFPLRNLSLWPIPNTANLQVALYVWQALSAWPDLAVTDITLPPAYMKAVRYNLAVDLAPEFGRSLPPEVAAQAISSKKIVKSMNIVPVEMACDPALTRKGGQYNWLTDEPVRRTN